MGLRASLMRWYPKVMGGIDPRSLIVGFTAGVLLILYLYHGKPSHFAATLPSVAAQIPRRWLPMASFAYSHLASVVLLMLVPMAVVALVFGESPARWGWRIRGTRREFALVLLMYLAFLPILVYVAQTPSFAAKYPKLKIIKDSALLFWAYEGLYLLKWISWEHFFRGFVLFGLQKRFGDGAIVASMLPFAVAHLGKPEGEALGAVVAGLVLGRIALSSRSIFPGVLLHFAVAGTMDFLTSTWWR